MQTSERPRARELGIKIGIMPIGETNTICDVADVKIGHSTLVWGAGELVRGKGPVRTGVTAIIPDKDMSPHRNKLPAAVDVINGFGKSVGLMQIDELGEIETPVLLTNTLNVGKVSQHLVEWMMQIDHRILSVNPVVMECNDSNLSDIWGMHVDREHVFNALENASKDLSEGCIGAGTGMRSFGYKSGIGMASRLVDCGGETYVLGALALNNMGGTGDLCIDGVPVGRMIQQKSEKESKGSIIMVIATDAPFNPVGLRRIARRASFGLARTGGMATHGSGDIALAFSTVPLFQGASHDMSLVWKNITSFFRACIESIEEAIINSLFRANKMVGRDGNTAHAVPVEKVIECMRKCGYGIG
ncbi:S58 family peptidase [Candidatus Poribacteria bacterium]|nr:S58 family peptidase [Candidatus Poribacteria bacterium]